MQTQQIKNKEPTMNDAWKMLTDELERQYQSLNLGDSESNSKLNKEPDFEDIS